ncbi:hypothetical protein CHRYSEO8AT_30075 [Chryseobacterium sp. 8AT]|nr:hypothetical protein CHRYSEO8AT_30075 [Chryseobacterium sp. 8AT]
MKELMRKYLKYVIQKVLFNQKCFSYDYNQCAGFAKKCKPYQKRTDP